MNVPILPVGLVRRSTGGAKSSKFPSPFGLTAWLASGPGNLWRGNVWDDTGAPLNP